MARSARQVMVGGVSLGGGAPVRVQSMTTAHTSDIEKTGEQIARLYAAGCEIVRVAVRGEEDARAIAKLKEFSPHVSHTCFSNFLIFLPFCEISKLITAFFELEACTLTENVRYASSSVIFTVVTEDLSGVK